jgi:hypothetical protein
MSDETMAIDLIDDSNRTGSMEFVVSAADAEAFYPIEVRVCHATLNPVGRRVSVMTPLPFPSHSASGFFL